jgi:hypothetical protein
METRIRLMEMLFYSAEVRIRHDIRYEYFQLLDELRRGVMEQQEREMLELRRAMEVQLRELAARHPCCYWCVDLTFVPILSAHS